MFPDNWYDRYGYDVNRYVSEKVSNCLHHNIILALDDFEPVVTKLNQIGIKAEIVNSDFEEAYNKVTNKNKE